MIHLEPIDAKNVWDVLDLKLRKEQKNFVASNEISIVQAYTAQGTGCSAFPFAICRDKDRKPVGFLMIGFNEAALYELDDEEPPASLKGNYSIWRLMIDKKYQNRGYGWRWTLSGPGPAGGPKPARSPSSRRTRSPERCTAPAASWRTSKRTGTSSSPC